MSLAAGPVGAVLLKLRGEIMYSNEMKALASVLETIAKAVRGEEFSDTVTVEGGATYDDFRELCAKIIGVAKAIEDRSAAALAYDNGASGLTAVTVQAAIDELAAR
jgi:hypothetical protein